MKNSLVKTIFQPLMKHSFIKHIQLSKPWLAQLDRKPFTNEWFGLHLASPNEGNIWLRQMLVEWLSMTNDQTLDEASLHQGQMECQLIVATINWPKKMATTKHFISKWKWRLSSSSFAWWRQHWQANVGGIVMKPKASSLLFILIERPNCYSQEAFSFLDQRMMNDQHQKATHQIDVDQMMMDQSMNQILATTFQSSHLLSSGKPLKSNGNKGKNTLKQGIFTTKWPRFGPQQKPCFTRSHDFCSCKFELAQICIRIAWFLTKSCSYRKEATLLS